MKIHIIFYKYISKIRNGNNAQKNYLSIKPLKNLLVNFSVEKTGSLSIFFSNPEFGMRVYKGKVEARSEGISLYTFLRISPRKIIILRKTKFYQREFNEVNDMNIKKNATQFNEYLEIYHKNAKKMKKNKSTQNFFILKHFIECFKQVSFITRSY